MENKEISFSDNNISIHSQVSSFKLECPEELVKIRKEFDKFFANQTAYINLKENNKLIVFNTDLSIKDVVDAMIHEDIYCGLIWNTELNKFSGLFTIRDCLIALYISYEKITKLSLKGCHWNNSKQLASLIFQKNDFQVEELDVIMENGNSYNGSDDEEDNNNKERSNNNANNLVSNNLNNNTQNSNNPVNLNQDYHSNSNVSNLSQKKLINNAYNSHEASNLVNIELLYGESKFSSYKEYFEIFNYVTLNEYLTDLHNDILFNNSIISVDLDCQLKEGIKLMQKNLIHRVVVEDKKNSIFVGLVTYESIFTYFSNNYYNYDMECFNVSYKKLGLVTYSLVCCYEDQTIYSCFFKIWEARISMMPILEIPQIKSGKKEIKVLGYLFLKDLVYFISNGEKFKFTDTIKVFLNELYSGVNEEKPLGQDRVAFIDDITDFTFKEIMEFINQSPEKKIILHRKDDLCSLLGVISLSDVFKLVFPV
jgi:CBS domain-containing protein